MARLTGPPPLAVAVAVRGRLGSGKDSTGGALTAALLNVVAAGAVLGVVGGGMYAVVGSSSDLWRGFPA